MIREHSDASGWGAYGFEVIGFTEPSDILVPVAADWPRIVVERQQIETTRRRPPHLERGESVIGPGRAELWLTDTDSMAIDRSPLRAQFLTTNRLSDELLAHPYLAWPAAVASYWLDRQVLHGGAVVHRGLAWGVLGTKAAGKSSTLGWFAARGHAILSDDLLVVADGRVLAGPRNIDLRAEAATVLGGRRLRTLGGRERFRIHSGKAPPSSRLGGLVYLEWGDEARVDSVPPIERVLLLMQNTVIGRPDLVDASAYVDMASLPTWRLVRPKRLDQLDEANRQLLEAIEGLA